CRAEDGDRLEAILFSETATFGVRRQMIERHKRVRRACTVTTPWGPVAGKLGSFGASVVFTPEFELCAKLAGQYAVPLRDVYRAAELAFEQNKAALLAEFAAAPSATATPTQTEHDHDQALDHSHDHSHDHDHAHDHDHRHDHDHGEGHDHHH